jgi:hypothetical protein
VRGASALIVLVSIALATAACGSSSAGKDSTSGTSPSEPAAATPGRVDVLASARAAIFVDHRLAVRALWTNRVPAHPAASAGPHLVDLRRSVATRLKRGIRVKLLSERFRIVSIDLDPSYTTATAVVADPQHVRPYGRDGRPLGRPVSLNERARLQLRRLSKRNRFVVWEVTAIR